MNITKSIKVALAQREQTQEWLANEVKMTAGALSALLTRNSIKSSLLDRMAKALNMKASELIALGETK